MSKMMRWVIVHVEESYIEPYLQEGYEPFAIYPQSHSGGLSGIPWTSPIIYLRKLEEVKEVSDAKQ